MHLSKTYLTELLYVNSNDISEEENFTEYNLNVSYSGAPLNLHMVKSIISSINERDNIFINEENSSSIIKYDSSDAQIQEAIDEINANLELEPVKILIKVKKNKTDTLSIYSSEKFFCFIDKYNSFDFLYVFNQLIVKDGVSNFQMLNDDIKLITKTFGFSSDKISFDDFDRDDYLRKANLIGKININYSLSLTPYDFKVLAQTDDKIILENTITRFKWLQYILSLRYISNESDFSKNLFEFYIFENTSINISAKYKIDAASSSIINDTINRIFEWAFADGNIVDKISIVRNILSLYNNDNFIDVSDTEYDSIIDNYQLHLKNQAKDYLELKKAVASKFQEFCDECADQISGFFSVIRKNLSAILGYIITVLFTKCVTNKSTNEIFSKDIAIIASFILAGSFIYWGISFYCYRRQNKYVYEKINKLRQYYNDIFDDELLKTIKNNTLTDFIKENNKRQVTALSITWILFLVVAYLVLDALSGQTKLLFILNIFD